MVKGRFLGACLLLLAAAAVVADGEEKQGKQGVRLLDAGRLEKFVDELPDMPVLRGYGVADGGNLVAGELAVGMFDTTWMRTRSMHSKTIGCLLEEKASKENHKGGCKSRSGILKENSCRRKSKKDSTRGKVQMVP